jgi:hypothetical protein
VVARTHIVVRGLANRNDLFECYPLR